MWTEVWFHFLMQPDMLGYVQSGDGPRVSNAKITTPVLQVIMLHLTVSLCKSIVEFNHIQEGQ